MPRIRSVHPGLFTDESFIALSAPAQIFYIALWTEADDQGVFAWRPVTLRLRLCPEARNVEKLLALLAESGLVREFCVEGAKYGAIADFRKFQKPQRPVHMHPLPKELRGYVGLDEAEHSSNTAPAQFEHSASTGKERREEECREEERREGTEGVDGKKDVSAGFSSLVPPQNYPVYFDKFWRGYPTTPIMSKFAAFGVWQRLSAADQDKALASLCAYRTHCKRDTRYRPLNPDRFLSERRFDALMAEEAQLMLDEDAMAALWGGRAAPLVAAIGAPIFSNFFVQAEFSPGPPVSIGLSSRVRCELAEENCGTKLRAVFGEDMRLVVIPKKLEPVKENAP
jgi:hypothetical protein